MPRDELAAQRLYDLALEFQERSQRSEARLLEQFEDASSVLIGKIGENMSIRRFKRYEGSKLASYLHGSRIGVLMSNRLEWVSSCFGIALAGSVASAQPASAGYACGPWNGYCGYFLYPGWGWNWGWYGNNHHHKWDNHGHNNWNGNGNWKGKGHNYGQAYKKGNWNKY